MNDGLFLGVDGGGSRCRARVVDAAGRRRGEGRGGMANIRLGLDRAWHSILTAADEALAEAGLDRSAFGRIHAGLGLAGIVSDEDRRRVLAKAPGFASIAIETDAHAACLGAFAGQDGAIAIIGTGSVGYALVDGRGHSVGGWGFELSDAGSGADIGRRAIKAAIEAFDGLGPASNLTDAVLDGLGGHPATIVAWVEHAKPKDYADFAPMVFDFAQAGDMVAIVIVNGATAAIGTLLGRLRGFGASQISLMGGVAPELARWFDDAIVEQLVPPRGDALDGAIIMARQAAGEL